MKARALHRRGISRRGCRWRQSPGDKISDRTLTKTKSLQAVGDGEGISEALQEPTGLPLTTLQWVGRAVAALPPDFRAHPSITKLTDSRR